MPRDSRAKPDVVEEAWTRFDVEIPDLEQLLDGAFSRGNMRVLPTAGTYLVRSTQQLRVSYAVGSTIADLATLLREVAGRWTWLYDLAGTAVADPAGARYLAAPALRQDPTYFAVRDLLAIAVSLGERDLVQSLAQTPMLSTAQDAVLDTLLTLAGVPRTIAETSLHGELDAGWLRLAHGPQEDRERELGDLVRSWAGTWQRVGLIDPPGHAQFIGNWCFDVVPLVAEYGLDDAPVHDIPAYPADLADAARSLR